LYWSACLIRTSLNLRGCYKKGTYLDFSKQHGHIYSCCLGIVDDKPVYGIVAYKLGAFKIIDLNFSEQRYTLDAAI